MRSETEKLNQLANARKFITKESYRKASQKRRKPVGERFLKFFTPIGEDDCWPWIGSTDSRGYGKIGEDGKLLIATHIALILDGRPRPTKAHVSCHTCDNPPCVNPKHLWWGTRKENQADMVKKGRDKQNYVAKITKEQALEIKNSKLSNLELSKKFGISKAQCSKIKSGKSWSKLP